MQIRISTRHGQLSDATRDKISSKVEKLSRHFERLTSIEVVIDLGNEEQPRVDINASAEHKQDFVATDRSTSLMGSVDSVVHKIDQQLRKYKERVQERHRNPDIRRQQVSLEGEVEGE